MFPVKETRMLAQSSQVTYNAFRVDSVHVMTKNPLTNAFLRKEIASDSNFQKNQKSSVKACWIALITSSSACPACF